MICKACGKVVPDNSIYCPMCGAPLDKVNAETNRHENSNNGNYNANTNTMNAKEREEMEFVQQKLSNGKLLGIVSIVTSILGLGSFGALDVVAIICGWLGLKQLKFVPNTNPDKSTAVLLNRAGILCSAGFIIVIAIFVIVALAAFPWIFSGLAALF